MKLEDFSSRMRNSKLIMENKILVEENEKIKKEYETLLFLVRDLRDCGSVGNEKWNEITEKLIDFLDDRDM